MVKFEVEDHDGNRQEVEAPDDMGLSLMEVFEASADTGLATCDGMVLWASCYVEAMVGQDGLGEAYDIELDPSDKLPEYCPASRLSCKIRTSEQVEAATFRLTGEDN